MPERLRSVLFVFVLGTTFACHDARISDAFVTEDPGWSKRGVGGTIALYLPNRIIDLVDVVHAGYGVGPGAGIGVHFTRYGRLLAVAGVDVGIGWFGRYARPYQAAVYALAAAGTKIAPPNADEKWTRWHVPKWDIGLYLHLLLDQAYIGIAPDEIVDFVVGLSTFDLKGDDW